ncbi:hypothetical protein RB195_012586 [Necator americanus]|uniref:SCP domain-containing protein n=1 Tax=Necator americanus TaxID=51031 RepID=A0ABR1DRT8_NECAM
MAVVILGVIISALSLTTTDAAAMSSSRNSLISDKWRDIVLSLHNEFRRTLAKGDQVGKNGKLTAAKNINTLHWDYNAEELAQLEAAKCSATITPPLNYGSIQSKISVKKSCDAIVTTQTEIRKWWDDGAKEQTDQNKVANNDKFSQMAYAETSAVACSYSTCSSNTELNLVCFYNKKAQQATLYDPNADGCTCAGCTAYLCPSTFDPAEFTSSVCPTCDPSTQKFREAALYLHNYYRGLVATGWAEDAKSKYAKPAKSMIQLTYDKAQEVAANAYLTQNNDCPTAPEDPGYSGENFWTSTDYKLSEEEAIEKAVEDWFGYLKTSGLGDDVTYASLSSNPAKQLGNVIHDKATSVGCAVKACQKAGVIVVDCRYDPKLTTGKIYETGTTCSSCGSNKKCSSLNGLCA